jgi:glutathione S-transferase
MMLGMSGEPMPPLFHITTAAEWAAAIDTGRYTGSTRGKTLAQEGFIHCSFAEQTAAVVAMLYADCPDPLVLLRIDPALVDAEIKVEPAVPGGDQDYPHIYGPLPVAAVVEVSPLTPG